ncbi:anti-sigma factor [Edaphobacter sp. HDX4]|uniref:anti-sigma factor n=1 Tax=Edaphobacter sp. HDX4 TaxID=2794064 RepID=UPI002FE69E5F
MNVMAHYEDTDLTLFAMQLLEEEDHRTVAEHVGACAFCRQELARLQGDLAACAYGVEMYSPAGVVRERVMHQLAREKRAAPVEEVVPPQRANAVTRVQEMEEPTLEFRRRGSNPAATRRPSEARSARSSRSAREDEDEARPRNGGRARGAFLWLGWAATAGLAVFASGLYIQEKNDRMELAANTGEVAQLRGDAVASTRLLTTMTDAHAHRVVLSGASAAGGESSAGGRVIYVARTGSLLLLADHLPALDAEKTYELWLIPADGRDPIPAGTFRPDDQGNGTVVLPPLPRAVAAKAFGVTVEDGAGSQTPTMPIVLAGS